MTAPKDQIEDTVINLYPQWDVVLERGEGVYLYDTNGKKYLDCAAGIAVSVLGHGHPAYVAAGKDQIDKLMMVTGNFPTEPKAKAAQYLTDHCCCDSVFFCNSGAEAVEGALKLARKWGHKTKGPDCKDIIVFDQAFHGRTYGAVSCTYKSTKQPEFGPYLPGIKRAQFNDIDSVRAQIDNNSCAVLIELIQGEGGIRPADKNFVKALRALCDEKNILLISDEIQAGIGRLGTFFAHSYYDIDIDICTLAKGLGGGFPVGAFMAQKEIGALFEPGDHGTTYGGNPLATRLVYETTKIINTPNFLKNVGTIGAYFVEKLDDLKDKTGLITEVRGIGLMIGLDTVFPIKTLLQKLLNNGLIATQAGEKALRLTPPLVFTKENVDDAVQIIAKSLSELDKS